MTRENNIINLIKKGFTKEQIKAEALDCSKQEIEDFFDKLIPISQKIISLTLDGFSEAEISEVLGISNTCVSRYLGCFINSKRVIKHAVSIVWQLKDKDEKISLSYFLESFFNF